MQIPRSFTHMVKDTSIARFQMAEDTGLTKMRNHRFSQLL
jgi:hypothetical protein